MSFFILCLLFSCSKDTDLLAEYVAADPSVGIIIQGMAVNDNFESNGRTPLVLDVLSNDTFPDMDKVNIIEISDPSYGTIVVNSDKTLTYVPTAADQGGTSDNAESGSEDNSVATTQSDGAEATETDNVTEGTATEAAQEAEQTEADPTESESTTEEPPADTENATTTGESSGEATATDETSTSEEPATEEAGQQTDEFTYTTETENEDGTTTTSEGTVTVTVTEDEGTTEAAEESVATQDYGPLKAFPSAEGFGKNATGGRGGYIVEVTNLNNSGSGSLREALKMKGARTIIFRVGGTIECTNFLDIPYDSGNVTIAGQTAPGEGITIKGAELRISASNVIVRHLRIRPGSSTSGSNEDGINITAYNGTHLRDIIIDHCSIMWGKDENVAVGVVGGGSVQNVTIQNSIIAENIATHYGLVIFAGGSKVSVVGNLFGHNMERNIRSGKKENTFEMVNNVVYGYRAATHPGYQNKFDVIGNVYIKNPNIATPFKTINLETSVGGVLEQTRAYIEDNYVEDGQFTISSTLSPYVTDSKVHDTGTTIRPSSQVKDWVLEHVGANLHRDAIDQRVVSEVYSKTGGFKSSDSQAGGYPTVQGGTPYTDTDGDGMSDGWEASNGLDLNNPEDGNGDRNGDGYTNLEDFLNEVDFQS